VCAYVHTYVCMYVCNCECTYIYVAGAVALTLEQAEQEEREKDLKSDKRGLKTELREMELAHEAAVKKLKLVCMYICTSVRRWCWYALIYSGLRINIGAYVRTYVCMYARHSKLYESTVYICGW